MRSGGTVPPAKRLVAPGIGPATPLGLRAVNRASLSDAIAPWRAGRLGVVRGLAVIRDIDAVSCSAEGRWGR